MPWEVDLEFEPHEAATEAEVSAVESQLGVRQLLPRGRELWRLLGEVASVQTNRLEYRRTKIAAKCSIGRFDLR